MGRARVVRTVDLPPARAFELWTDLSRWFTFIDGFGHVDRVDDEWPRTGAKLVWRSIPNGRGVVTEKVRASEPGARIETEVLEQRLIGTQTVEFTPGEEGGTDVAMSLDYKALTGGPLGPLVDLLFIRRAQGDALARTLRRFATEAADEAAL
jgi:uncharacterized protein YndB with AHSA1/START domain